jgi:DNA invertase Pin-like site-specific DNA recombinase
VLVRAQGKEILAQALAAFDADDMLAEVYLQVDSVRTQQDIAAVLQVQGRPGSKAMLVSRKLDRLYTELDLIALVDHTGKGNVYKKAGVDRILGITRQLEKRRANKGKRERTQPAGG